MSPIARAIMGEFGVFVAWMLRCVAWRSGVIFSRRILFDVNERPIIFTLGFVAHIGIVVMRAAFAAGHTRMRFASSCSGTLDAGC